MVYVISDLHGCFDEFCQMLDLINFTDEDELYIIGDAVDRGPDSIKLLRYIMDSHNIKLLMGNHEEMMFDSLISPYLMPEERNDMKHSSFLSERQFIWTYNGGTNTAKEYNGLTYKNQKEIYDYLNSLEKYKEITVENKRYLLIHGGPTKKFIETWQSDVYKDFDILWDRIEKNQFDINLISENIIIVGHTPTFIYGEEYKGKIIRAKNKYLIDCGYVFGHTFGCLCLNDGSEYYLTQ